MSTSEIVVPFWDPAMKTSRRTFYKSLFPFFIVITLVLWAVLPIFWGSVTLLEFYFYRLNIDVVDFDSQVSGNNALVGPTVSHSLNQLNFNQGPHLNYQIKDPAIFPNGVQDVMQRVGHSFSWGAVVIYPNATTAWRQAIENGNANYDPAGTVGLYYSGAHFYQVVLLYIAPIMVENVKVALSEASNMATRSFLQDVINSQNATALTTASLAPQTLGTAFGFFRHDVRPITAWAAAAPFEAGLIYVVIFTFHLVLFGFIGRATSGMLVKLNLKSLIKLRLAVPAFCYFWFSLWYTCVVRAFQVPLENSVGRAGFVTFWALSYLTYLACGLALEALFSLLTIRWFPFSLILWIILNISSSFLPITLMHPFYRWGRAWPFRLNVEASKIIFFDTQPRHYLGRYFGGEMAWAFAGVISVTLFQSLDRWRMDRNIRIQKERKDVGKEEEMGDGEQIRDADKDREATKANSSRKESSAGNQSDERRTESTIDFNGGYEAPKKKDHRRTENGVTNI